MTLIDLEKEKIRTLRWTSWMPLMAAHPLAMAQLPSEPGFYRIRRTGSVDRSTYSAPHGVRETVERLSRQVHLQVEPYDDPDAPALAMWRMRREQGATFEVSGARMSDPG